MYTDTIISTLIGLVGACGNNPKTENTDALIIKALALSSGSGSASEIVSEIRAEKNRIAPGCATCASPCGNTSDYDMSRIYNAEEDIREVKLQILSELQETASFIYQNKVSLSDKETEIFYKALSYISYDLSKDSLLQILNQLQTTKHDIKEKN